MKIKLIAPHEQREDNISSAETFKIQKVNLPLLAALTPPEHTVTIVDEAFAPDDINEDVDLVGITLMTELALRAYQIADVYHQRGVKVVMGGIHPTILPDEAFQHAEAVVIGEAEEVWPRLLSDAASREMPKLYCASKISDLNRIPKPRRDLYPRARRKGYTPLAPGIETARGCPYDCEFCSIGSVMGRQYRSRPTYSLGSIIKRFFGITPWKRTAIGCWVYAGFNLATRKRYFKGLNIPQPFIGQP
jgi:radical SAM superfamily enzyme YgiQ (UPF0313 family)